MKKERIEHVGVSAFVVTAVTAAPEVTLPPPVPRSSAEW